MISQEQLKTINDRLEALRGYLWMLMKKELIKEEELITQDPEFWNDPKKAEVVLKSIKNKKLWVSSYDNLKTNLEDTEVLFQFFKEGEVEEEEVMEQYQLLLKNLDDLELKNSYLQKRIIWMQFYKLLLELEGRKVVTGVLC